MNIVILAAPVKGASSENEKSIEAFVKRDIYRLIVGQAPTKVYVMGDGAANTVAWAKSAARKAGKRATMLPLGMDKLDDVVVLERLLGMGGRLIHILPISGRGRTAQTFRLLSKENKEASTDLWDLMPIHRPAKGTKRKARPILEGEPKPLSLWGAP